MEKLYMIENQRDLDELNEVLNKGGTVKMIHSTSPNDTRSRSIVYVVVVYYPDHDKLVSELFK